MGCASTCCASPLSSIAKSCLHLAASVTRGRTYVNCSLPRRGWPTFFEARPSSRLMRCFGAPPAWQPCPAVAACAPARRRSCAKGPGQMTLHRSEAGCDEYRWEKSASWCAKGAEHFAWRQEPRRWKSQPALWPNRARLPMADRFSIDSQPPCRDAAVQTGCKLVGGQRAEAKKLASHCGLGVDADWKADPGPQPHPRGLKSDSTCWMSKGWSRLHVTAVYSSKGMLKNWMHPLSIANYSCHSARPRIA